MQLSIPTPRSQPQHGAFRSAGLCATRPKGRTAPAGALRSHLRDTHSRPRPARPRPPAAPQGTERARSCRGLLGSAAARCFSLIPASSPSPQRLHKRAGEGPEPPAAPGPQQPPRAMEASTRGCPRPPRDRTAAARRPTPVGRCPSPPPRPVRPPVPPRGSAARYRRGRAWRRAAAVPVERRVRPRAPGPYPVPPARLLWEAGDEEKRRGHGAAPRPPRPGLYLGAPRGRAARCWSGAIRAAAARPLLGPPPARPAAVPQGASRPAPPLSRAPERPR